MELITETGRLCERASALVSGAMEKAEPEELCAALSNVHEGLMEAAAALRAKEVAAEVLALARAAGAAEGYERGLQDGRRHAQGRRSRADLALVPRAG